MKTTIITDRWSIEKMAEDIFLQKQLLLQDYRGLQRLRENGTFRYAISCQGTFSNCIDSIQTAIKEVLPAQEAMYVLCNFTIGDNGNEKTAGNMIAILEQVQQIFSTEKIWRSLNSSNDIPSGEIRVNILFLFEKTEEDREEDIKVEKMLEEYRGDNPSIPELPWFVEAL